MKRIYKITLYAFAVLLVACAENSHKKDYKLNVLTTNIRCSVLSDSTNYWDYRKEWLTDCLNFFEPDVFGAQEVTHPQLQDMLLLMPNYAYIGISRDGGTVSEYSPVFYKKDKYDVVESNTFWLSENIDSISSIGWDAAYARIVSWAKFKDKISGFVFYYFNTHFDHIGIVARTESAKLLVAKVSEIAGENPVIISGDFNATPAEESYNILHDNFKDSYLACEKRYGPEYTFNGFVLEPNTQRERIDYIFTSKQVQVLQHYIVDGQRGARYMSDHFPIYVTTRITKN